MANIDPNASSVYVDQGATICEDTATLMDNAAWVFDGASGVSHNTITDFSSDGEWYVRRFDDHLRESITADRSLREITASIIDTLRNEYFSYANTCDLDAVEYPLAAGVILRWDEATIEYLQASDCSFVVRFTDGSTAVHLGQGPRAWDALTIESIIEKQRTQDLDHNTAREEARDLIETSREYKNTTEGYWTFGFDQEATNHFHIGEFDRNSIVALLIFSDGFERLVETFPAFETWDNVIDFIQCYDLDHTFRILREFEQRDPDCLQYPRMKQSDDAACVYLEFPDQNVNHK
ncbi:MAG: hypothetical protein ABEI06_04850 [Halobacteriaceae archaeon]